jgi:hypothetical protein
MQMKRLRLTLVVAVLALAALGWRAAEAGDPDTPQVVTKRLIRAPHSDGTPGYSRTSEHYWWIGRVLVSVYLGRWFAR